MEICRLIIDKPSIDIVYIDETSFNIWQAPSRVWLKPGMKMELPNSRGQSIAMIGALSIQRGLIHQMTFAGSNNTDTFHPFITKLKEKCSDRRCIVVMDNLSVHKSKVIQDVFDDAFQQKFLPPQSCELNPIEKVWNILKMKWRKTSYMILENNDKTEEKVQAAVDMIRCLADEADNEMMLKIARCNYKTMARALRGHLV
jgi:transposase